MARSINNHYRVTLLFLFLLSSFWIAKAQTLNVDLTYYHATNNSLTADGSKINIYHLKKNYIKWCAVSRDIWNMFPKNCTNKRIYIEGFGIYYVKDKMHKRWKHKIDILVHPKHAKRINKNKVKIKILKCND